MDLKGDTKSPITKFGQLHIPLEDVLKATNNFDDQNVIGRGELGKVYQGRLLQSGKLVKIDARRFYSKHKHGIEFLREISALSSLEHDNIVSIIGFCDEQNEKVIIYKREAKGNLEMHLSKPNVRWIQRLRISIGSARALCYIHNERSLMHLNINSSTILLNNKFELKLSGFEYSIRHSVHRMNDVHEVHLTAAIGTTGYIDPEIVKTGGVTHKSDIYSFGVVLLELLSARKAFIRNDDDDRFLVARAKLNSEDSDIKDLVPSNRYEQIGYESGNIFTSVARYCLKEERIQRPDMKYIVGKLEKALELQLPYEISIVRPYSLFFFFSAIIIISVSSLLTIILVDNKELSRDAVDINMFKCGWRNWIKMGSVF
ncbi:probable receptor-like protein kinase At2g23200 [Rutidosis leptorrhynchoides]|uniref:probable receptor-like protein kinase At2g23200 n=1 Tax=Rutidosis leptorrhynchoides TaxID=125765 RepID=UPI003A99D6D2